MLGSCCSSCSSSVDDDEVLFLDVEGIEISRTRKRVVISSGFEEAEGGERRGDQEVVV